MRAQDPEAIAGLNAVYLRQLANTYLDTVHDLLLFLRIYEPSTGMKYAQIVGILNVALMKVQVGGIFLGEEV